MDAGFATADITPAIDSRLNGFIARLRPATAIDAPLTARALWLEDERTKCVIISLDVLGLSTADADLFTEHLADHLDLPEENIVVACTHNHSGPMTCQLRGIGPRDAAYLRTLKSQIHQAASAAADSKRQVEVAWGESPLEISVNRRQIDPLTGRSVLGQNPGRPTDRAVKVLQLRSDNSSIVLFSYACHPYCLGPEHNLISPDFPGHAALALEAAGHKAIFLNGCCGDLAPRRSCEGPEAAKSEGQKLAAAVLLACRQARVEESAKIQVDSARFTLAHDELPPLEMLEQALYKSDTTVRPDDRKDQRVVTRVRAAWSHWLEELKQVAGGGRPLSPISTRASLVRIGQGVIAALPGEIFFQLGQRLAARIPGNPVWVAAYCHGYIGYVPTREAYGEGGYEVDESHRYVSLWRVSPDAEKTLAQQVDLLCAKLASK